MQPQCESPVSGNQRLLLPRFRTLSLKIRGSVVRWRPDLQHLYHADIAAKDVCIDEHANDLLPSAYCKCTCYGDTTSSRPRSTSLSSVWMTVRRASCGSTILCLSQTRILRVFREGKLLFAHAGEPLSYRGSVSPRLLALAFDGICAVPGDAF